MSLVEYEDSDTEATRTSATSVTSVTNLKERFHIELAPEVRGPRLEAQYYEAPHVTELTYNPTYEAIWAPVEGPTLPYSKGTLETIPKNSPTGYVEEYAMSDFHFDHQFHNFNTLSQLSNLNPNRTEGESGAKRKGAMLFSDPKDSSFMGPWAPPPVSAEERSIPYQELPMDVLAREERELNKEKDQDQNKKKRRDMDMVETKSIFHGKSLHDYQGRTYIDAPSELKTGPHECFIPKKLIHTWVGHTKGVSAIRFFPRSGHLLLSAGLDSKVKLWDVYNDRQCLRTFKGHQKAVRDICFSNDGRRFLSCGYDRYLRLWDTETGECLGSFTNGRIPYCVKFNPDDNRQHEFLVGGSDKKIIQWDVRKNSIVQEYDQHLGAVNTITFIDDNRRFVTSSDDKSIRIWEYGIPVVIKYISEPHMHSMPSIAVHPNGNWFVGQSLDNQLLVYSTRERFKLNKKKRFLGHLVAGFACQLNFAPDGRFIMSGDADGKLWFWDWKSTKVYRTLRCHNGVCIGCEWHPIEASRVATCGWDGAIHYWD
eukprot:TRINITY_DN5820_c0_g1_i2.p1 TRINITY_DN5820_c0_g1~~TRINITY_DN5820_c0_g1_i2.p1  ORF type:complete len:538 (-),score=81.54 TRINITY_DN5820_c0_g1_i2:98-1711(-)